MTHLCAYFRQKSTKVHSRGRLGASSALVPWPHVFQNGNTMNKATEGRVLLVGEGNFSLSASLIDNGTVSGPQLTASCIETFNAAVQQSHRLAAGNIEFIEKAGKLQNFRYLVLVLQESCFICVCRHTRSPCDMCGQYMTTVRYRLRKNWKDVVHRGVDNFNTLDNLICACSFRWNSPV
jgi:hypothetical protein